MFLVSRRSLPILRSSPHRHPRGDRDGLVQVRTLKEIRISDEGDATVVEGVKVRRMWEIGVVNKSVES
jgi:hypothetical protein